MEIKKKLKPAIFAGFCGNPELVLQKRPGPVAASLKQPFCLRFLRVGKMGKIAPQKARYSLGYISRLVRGFLM